MSIVFISVLGVFLHMVKLNENEKRCHRKYVNLIFFQLKFNWFFLLLFFVVLVNYNNPVFCKTDSKYNKSYYIISMILKKMLVFKVIKLLKTL